MSQQQFFPNRGGCVGHRQFDSELSSTFRALKSKEGETAASFIQYGTGSCKSAFPFVGLPFDGIVGLGFPDQETGSKLPSSALPLVDALKSHHLSFTTTLECFSTQRICSIHIATFPQVYMASSQFGAINPQFAQQNKTARWFPVISVGKFLILCRVATLQTKNCTCSTLDYWEIGIHSIKVGDESFKTCRKEGCRAAVDTGSSLITGPSSIILPLLETLNVATDCSNKDNLPEISFVLRDFRGHNVRFPLKPRDYLIEEIDENGKSIQC
ncbi:putative aspartyl proteinase (eimepsin) [Cardiosporidium cionae]|uniref:Aspartyl proteinase (Eimepsin) n=1 Tax=Cardiosporidium cionae TaxID=476202 RepID=A0ABQ7JE31_9APIC|nr:putative aspartyl proteinase (eimepsin) [Cardiosporidium cionae]|eukprot:KAF8822264.1 putative aspartyl proteinase (eimepsin) [Cardiosporidium cionae]